MSGAEPAVLLRPVVVAVAWGLSWWGLWLAAVGGLLLPAGLVTYARLAAPETQGWVMLRTLTPFASAPYALALLLTVLAITRGRGPGRGVALGVGLVVLVALVLHLSWARGPYVGATPLAGGHNLVVMSANLHLGEGDVERLLDQARTSDVDVIVLEEITGPALTRMTMAGVRQDYPYTAGSAGWTREGTMVFSRYPIRSTSVIEASSPAYSGDLLVDGTRIHFVALHPTAPNNGVRTWLADHAAVRAAVARQEGPVMLVGDFNATMDHQPILDLLDDGFTDAATVAKSGWQPTWPAGGNLSLFGKVLPPLFPLDHVMTRGGVRALWTDTVDVPGSDHRALLAGLSW